ncbi:MAG: hypothetical protein AB8G16_06445 [Gammaproteobacteria bacterium]
MSQAIVSVEPEKASPRKIAGEFRALLQHGHVLRPAGEARYDPEHLLSRGYTPRFRLDLFGARFYLTALRQEDQFRFFVAYVRLPQEQTSRGAWPIYPRIFYKDSSLIWRCASHFIESDNDQWIGKGALKPVPGDPDLLASAEETTNLPFELQSGLDQVSRMAGKARPDHRAIALVLRRAPENRVAPYEDFSKPRRAFENKINRGRPIGRFVRHNDPESLQFVPGYAPDLCGGLIDKSFSRSGIYGGAITKYRFVSDNKKVQYTFVAAPRQVWILPPQTLTQALFSYGLRPIDVPCDEDVCLPGFEFHYAGHSQIPPGFAGAPSDVDPSRADTSPWNERMPVVRDFRRRFNIRRA